MYHEKSWWLSKLSDVVQVKQFMLNGATFLFSQPEQSWSTWIEQDGHTMIVGEEKLIRR